LVVRLPLQLGLLALIAWSTGALSFCGGGHSVAECARFPAHGGQAFGSGGPLQDIFADDPLTVGKTRVTMTIVGGKV